MKNILITILLILTLIPVVTSGISLPPPTTEITSPDKKIKLKISVKNIANKKNVPVYEITYNGKKIIADAQLGLILKKQSLNENLKIISSSYFIHKDSWKPIYGERSTITNHYRQLSINFDSTQNKNYRLGITFRCYNTGVAFRYNIISLPKGKKNINICQDCSEFAFLANHPIWAAPRPQSPHYKKTINTLKKTAECPILIKIDKNNYVAIAEATLQNFCKMQLINKKKNIIKSQLYDDKSIVTLPFSTPWRVIMLANSPAKLLENNDIILNLNPPCAIKDTSWIKPGKVIREVTLSTHGGKACVDFAVKHNLQYVEFDAGWYGPENNPKSDATTITLDPKRSPGPLNLQEVINYAKKRNIGIILYVNSRAMSTQLDKMLPLYNKWGIAGVKYGFVPTGSQKWTNWLHKAVRKAAKYQLMVDIHDNYRPTGFSRTYPNLMTQEGIRGDEERQTSDTCLTTIFIRPLAGAADNTICYHDPRVDKYSAHAYQLAKAVCFYSPWQFLYWYDRPKASGTKIKGGVGGDIIEEGKELEFFDNVPTVWDDTKVLQGEVGKYIITARRNKQKWFVGVLNSQQKRNIKIPLNFLKPNKQYTAYIYSDNANLTTKTKVKIEKISVNNKTIIQKTIAPNSGLAIRIVPQTNIYHKTWIDFNKNGKMDPYENPTLAIEQRVENLLSQMNIAEKTCQLVTLYGYRRVLKDPLPTPQWKTKLWKDGLANIDEHLNAVHGRGLKYSKTPQLNAENLNKTQKFFVEKTRLGIPVDFTTEGIRGLCARHATNFPAQIGVGCSWNKELVKNIGTIVGKEAQALGYTNVYAPILDLARDPRWGRVVECYSEDPFLVSTYGYEMITALQKSQRAATPKHFAIYSIPKGGRDGNCRTDPHVAPREMQTLYLAPFKTAFKDAHALGVMSSYNDYDGIPVSASHYFLTELLRKQWGFKGYVVSDSDAVIFVNKKHHVAKNYKDAVRQVINAGLNVRTTFNAPENFVIPLRELIKEGKISMTTLNNRVRDVLRVKFTVGLFDHPYTQNTARANQILGCKAHQKISLQASRESIVLLKNKNHLLPLNRNKIKSIAVIGPNAKETTAMTSRYGPYNPKVISVYDGIKQLAKNIDVKYAKGCNITDKNWPASELYPENPNPQERNQIQQAVRLAKQSDIIIAVVGSSCKTVGESVSRTSLQLPGYQKLLLRELYKTGKPIIVVLINGRPLAINWTNKYIPAIIEAWFPGSYCGQAIAEVLFGDYNPGGKLSVTFPRTVGQIPLNFPCKPNSQAGQKRNPDPNGCGNSRVVEPLYPFGYGLSYTTFKYKNLKLSTKQITTNSTLNISLQITNTGEKTGDEVVQLYLKDDYSTVTQYEKLLRGFQRIHLKPNETKNINFTINPKDMQLLNKNMQWVVEPGTFTIMVGASSQDIRLQTKFTVMPTE